MVDENKVTDQMEHMGLWTFRLIDGRYVTYEGRSESDAFSRALRYHPYAVETVGKKRRDVSAAVREIAFRRSEKPGG